MKLSWRSELSDIFSSAMEAAWLSPVLLAIGYALAEQRVVMVGLPLCALLYGARFLARHVIDAQLDLGRSRMLLIYMAAGSVLLALKVQNYPTWSWLNGGWLSQATHDLTDLSPALGSIMLTAGTVIYGWWRAVRVTRGRAHPSYLFQQFEVGLLAIVMSTFIANRVGLGGDFLPWIFWFFFWGLLAIAVTRLEDIARNRRATVEAYWLPILFAVAVLVIAAGGIVSLVYSREMIAALRALLQPVGKLFDLLVYIIALPIGYLVQFLVWLLKPLLGPLLARMAERMPGLQQPANPLDKLPQQTQPAHLSPLLQEALKWLLIILIVAGVFMLLARTLRRRIAEEESDVEEVRESVWSLAELRAGLRALWQRILAALGRGQKRTIVHPPAQAKEEDRAAHTIRQVYMRLMEMAAGLGHARPVSSTPYEYLGELGALLPACQPDLTFITDAYVCARYGTVTVAAEVEQAQEAWQRVRQEGGRIKLEMEKKAQAQRRPRIGVRG